MKKIVFLMLLTMQSTIAGLQTPYKAIIIVPVADLAGQSLQEQNKDSIITIYKNFSICGKKGEFACPRVHQALFHEYVTVLEERNQEVLIKINNFFFETDRDAARHDTFWSLKRNFLPVTHLKQHGINEKLIPEPVVTNQKQKTNQKIITLLHPFKDPISGLAYSVGTRFVQAPTQQHPQRVSAYALNPHNTHMHTIEFPKNIVTATQNLSPLQKKALFVRLCRSWANTSQGFIPYVWGGCSLTNLYTHEPFKVQEAKDHRGYTVSYFKRNEPRHPHSGFDCAGLIARAAQTAGLPYYFKNTTTLSKHLAPYSNNTPVQAGDLVWLPGHVMIIGNVEKNTIIEARHYSHGYGKIHELPVEKIFKGIKTLENLKQAYLNHKPLERLDKDQNTIQSLKQYKLLQLGSIF